MDSLVIVPSNQNLGRKLRHLLNHRPLQRRQILCLIHNQHVQVRRLRNVYVVGDHVSEVYLVLLGLVLCQLLGNLHQLGEVQRVILFVVILIVQGRFPIDSPHDQLQVLGPRSSHRRDRDPVIHRGRIRTFELQAQHLTQNLVVLAAHNIPTLKAQTMIACSM